MKNDQEKEYILFGFLNRTSCNSCCSSDFCRELHRIPNLWETKIEKKKTQAKEKQSHAQDNIYVVRQFAYVHRVAGISLFSRKNLTPDAATIFSLYIRHGNWLYKKP